MLVRYKPWQELSNFQSQIDRLFEETLQQYGVVERDGIKVPAAELQETEEAIHLKLELPGIDLKDIDVQVSKSSVHITAERKTERRAEDKGVTKSEFHYGKFQRVIPLSLQVDNTKVVADYNNGILNLTLPKAEKEKNKIVKINLGQNSD
jgi:HSP20 family protein